MEIRIIESVKAEGVDKGAIRIHFDTFCKLVTPTVLEEDGVFFNSTPCLLDAASSVNEESALIVVNFIYNKLNAKKNLILKAIAAGKTHFDTDYYEVSVNLNRIEYVIAKQAVK